MPSIANVRLSSDWHSYAVDGNAMFLSAAEAAWRRATSPHFGDGGVVVAIGYQLDDHVYSPRRGYDLTPPSPTSPGGYGGAEHLLDFIEETLKPFVSSTVLPNTTIGREALFGHSFGGLFTLHALFTRPHMFDCYIAGSPSIYWDDFALLKHEDRFRNGNGQKSLKKPALMMLYGSFEQHPAQWADEDDETYKKRRQGAESRAMADSSIAMQGRLKDCGRLSCATIKEYPEEDHGTVIACALSRSLTTFFEEWPIREHDKQIPP